MYQVSLKYGADVLCKWQGVNLTKNNSEICSEFNIKPGHL